MLPDVHGYWGLTVLVYVPPSTGTVLPEYVPGWGVDTLELVAEALSPSTVVHTQRLGVVAWRAVSCYSQPDACPKMPGMTNGLLRRHHLGT